MKVIIVVVLISLFSSSQSHRLRNLNSKKFLKASYTDATQVESYPTDMTVSYFERELTSEDNGWIQILYNSVQNKCLTVSRDSVNEGKQNGAPVMLLVCTDDAWNQQWQKVYDPNVLSFQLVNRYSGKCLAVSGASMNAGATVYSWECVGGATNQLWNYVRD